jgi:hypothetical protein
MEIVSEPDLRFALYPYAASITEQYVAPQKKLAHMYAPCKLFCGLLVPVTGIWSRSFQLLC